MVSGPRNKAMLIKTRKKVVVGMRRKTEREKKRRMVSCNNGRVDKTRR